MRNMHVVDRIGSPRAKKTTNFDLAAVYSRAFVASESAPVSEYGVAISDDFDQWLQQANVPFQATSSFFQVGAE